MHDITEHSGNQPRLSLADMGRCRILAENFSQQTVRLGKIFRRREVLQIVGDAFRWIGSIRSVFGEFGERENHHQKEDDHHDTG